jgi:tetratricopeptide (TPR) repeat protein
MSNNYYIIIGNYRSSINDASKCLEFKEDHIKAYIRGAEANAKLCKYTEALDWCERGIKVDPLCKKLVELKKAMTLEKKKQERDERKQKVVDKKSEQKRKLLLEAIKSRGVLHAHSSDDISSSHCSNEEDMDYIIDGPHPTISGVHFDDEGFLVWPVIFLYPEYGQTDLVQSFHENNK